MISAHRLRAVWYIIFVRSIKTASNMISAHRIRTSSHIMSADRTKKASLPYDRRPLDRIELTIVFYTSWWLKFLVVVLDWLFKSLEAITWFGNLCVPPLIGVCHQNNVGIRTSRALRRLQNFQVHISMCMQSSCFTSGCGETGL
jgi:hypothetical protein